MSTNQTSLAAIKAALEQKKNEQIALREKQMSEKMGKQISGKNK